jgi:hypothetical protein
MLRKDKLLFAGPAGLSWVLSMGEVFPLISSEDSQALLFCPLVQPTME